MKTAIISQPFGAGDHIYTITICQDYIERGYRVIYPVKPHYVEGNMRAYPQITWIPDSMIDKSLLLEKEFKEIDGNFIVPLRWSDLYKGLPYSQTMRSKYLMLGFDYRHWKGHAMWRRDSEKESELFYEVLGLKDGDEYNLISLRFGTNSEYSAAVNVNNGMPNVEMRSIEGFSLFDWALVMERATTIHAVSSACFYMFELLNTVAVNLYTRRPLEKDFDNIRYLMTKSYILHEERIPCRVQHLWGGIAPIVEASVHKIQNEELIGKPCDCGKMVYDESTCSCPKKDKWEIKYLEAKS